MSGASVSSSQSHDSSSSGSHSPVKTSTNKRRSSKVYEPDLSGVTDSLVAELYMSPAPWTHKSLYGLPKKPPKTSPPPERFIVEHLAAHRRFIPDPRWWDRHGIDLPLGGYDKRHLMVERYGMRVPFPVETVFRWFEEILTLLRLRASALLHDSPWRKWPVQSLVSLLREHAWGDAPAQALLHMAQNKGVEQLVCLAHRWKLKLLHERYGAAGYTFYQWRPAGRTLVVSGASEAAASAAVPPPRDARLVAGTATDESLVEHIEPRVDHPADPLPYSSEPDWDDHLHPEDADVALAKMNARAAARSDLRFGREQDALNARPVRMGGGPGTGRDPVALPPAPGESQKGSPTPGAESPSKGAATGSTDTGLGIVTATDRVMATMQVREAARAEALTRMEDKNLDLLPPRPKGGWKHDAIQPEPEKDDVTPPWRLSAARRYPRSPAAKKLQLAQAEAAAQSAAQATAPSMSPLTSLPPMPSISPRSPQPTSNLMTSSSACSPRSPQSPDGSVNSTGSSSATSGSQASYSTSGSTLNGGMTPNNRRRRRPRKGNVAFGSGLVDVKHVADGAFADSTGASRAGAFNNRPASPAKLSATARAKHVEMLQLQERLAAAAFYNDDNDLTSHNHPHPSPMNGGSFNSKTTNLPPVSAATLAAAAATGTAIRIDPSSSSSSAFSLQRQSLAFGISSAEGGAGLPTDSFAGAQFTGMTQYDLWDDGSGSDHEEEDPDMNAQEHAALAAKKQAKRNHRRLEKLRFAGTFGGGYGFSDGQGIAPPTLTGSPQHEAEMRSTPPPLGASTLSFAANTLQEESDTDNSHQALPFANFFPLDFGPYGGEFGNGETGSAETAASVSEAQSHHSSQQPSKSNRSVTSPNQKQGSAAANAKAKAPPVGATQTLPKVSTPQKGPPVSANKSHAKTTTDQGQSLGSPTGVLAPPLVSPLVASSSSPTTTSMPAASSTASSSASHAGAPQASRRVGRAAGTLPSLVEPISDGGGGGLEQPISDGGGNGSGSQVLLGGGSSESVVEQEGSGDVHDSQHLMVQGGSLAQGSMASTVIWAGDEPSGQTSRALSAQFASVARAEPSASLADPSASMAESTNDDSVMIEAGDSFTLSPRSRHAAAAAPANASTTATTANSGAASSTAGAANVAGKGSPVAAFDLSAADGSVVAPPSFTAADRRAVKFLLEACAAGHINDLVDMYAAVGPGPLTEWVDGRRRGPLHYAASHGRAPTCLWLMEHGAHAFARDLDGRAPLHLAAAEGHEDALRALLNHPAARPRRPDPVDRLGRTPLHDACWRAQKYTAEALLRNGASVAARDAQGFTPIERASQGRRTALVEYLTRQQIIPLDYNLTFTQYHTYDEHKVLNAEKREALIIKRAEDAKEKAEFAEAAAREAAAMDHFKRSGQVPRLVGLSGSSSSSQPAAAAGGGGVSKEWATTIPEGELHLGTLPTSGWAHGGAGAGGAGGLSGADGEPMGARAAAKAARRASRAAAKALKAKKRNPKQVPTLNSESALEHPTASAGGLDELLTESPAFPFPRAVHLRERRARDPDLQGDSDDDSDDSDDSEGSAHRDDDDEDGAFDSDSEDSIESDDYDEDPKEASVTSTADEAVRLAMVFAATGGVAFGGAAARPVSPGGLGAPTPRTPRTGRSDSSHGATHRAGAAAARAEAEDLASKVTQYMGGPPVDGVGAELKMLFSTLPVTPAAFARGKVSTPAFMHSMISPCIDPGDITGNKARTRLRLLEGRHRSMDPDADAAAQQAIAREEDAQEEERLTGSRPTTANHSAKSTARQALDGTNTARSSSGGGMHTGGSSTARSQGLNDEGALTGRSTSRDTPTRSNHGAAQAH